MHRALLLASLLALLARSGELTAAPSQAEGSAWISAQVLRDGSPVVARVELRYLEDMAGADPWWFHQPQMRSRDVPGYRRWLAPGAATGPALATSESAAGDGRVRFEGLVPGLYELVAQPKEGLGTHGLARIDAQGQHVETLLRLSAGRHTLRGRLRHADGRPFVGTAVIEQPDTARWARPWLDGAWERSTDAQGSFELAGLDACEYCVTALLPGQRRTRLVPVRLPREGAREWVVDEGGSLRPSRVVPFGSAEGVAGAELFAHGSLYPELGFTLLRLEADAEGRFTLPAIAGKVELLCLAPGYATSWLELDPGAAAIPPIGLDRAARIEGRVLREDGTPLVGALLRVQPVSMFADAPETSLRSDADGRFAVDSLAPIETRVIVQDEGWASPGLAEDDASAGFDPFGEQLEPGVTLTLERRAEPTLAIHGRVVDTQNRPVAGAHAQAWGGWDTNLHAASDSTGAFRLAGVIPGVQLRLVVTAPGFMPAQARDAGTGAQIPDVVLTPRASRWLTVRVTDNAQGAPIEGALVTAGRGIEELRGDQGAAEICGITGQDGSVRVGPVTGGEINVRAEARHSGPSPQRALSRDDTSPITLVLGPRLLTIEGRITPAPGAPLPQLLDLLRSGPGEPPIGALTNGGTPVLVEPDGRFRAEGLTAGRYVLRASGRVGPQLYEGQVQVPAGGEPVLMPLRAVGRELPAEAATWRLQVRAHDGLPVPRGIGSAIEDVPPPRDEPGPIGISDGKALYRASKPGIERLERVVLGDFHTLSGRWLPYAFVWEDGLLNRTTPVEIELPKERSITGRILGPDGAGLRGVRVHARVLGSWDGARGDGHLLARSALSSADGRFRLGGLGEGWHAQLLFDVPRSVASEAPVLVTPDAPYLVVLRLCAAVAPRILVTDPDGVPLTGAGLRIEPDEEDSETFINNVQIESFYSGPGWVTEECDAQGRAGFARLDPRKAYSLFVAPPEGRSDLDALHLPAWRPVADETFVLPRAPR